MSAFEHTFNIASRIVSYLSAVVVCSSVSVLMMTVSPAETAEPIEMQPWGQTCMGARNHVLDRDVDTIVAVSYALNHYQNSMKTQ